MSSAVPTGKHFEQYANGTDLITIILGLQRDVVKLQRDLNQLGSAVGWLTTPVMPATTVNATNTFGVPATVYVRGGTVTNITIDGVATGFTSGTFRVRAGGTINITYSVAPVWFWYGD
jgi:hypothetical protein